ncbi:MAG TPA: tyrosine--tRNA ligase [Patescibacteria group bacterium]|nr:tyrosine--tRNA ligase [Patescibacteria group bacterium]
MTKREKIDQLLSRGVAEVIVKDHVRARLESGKKLRVKLGIDPSGADLHIGHMVVLRKLREFQELGHQAVLVVGTFTGQIGDPSGKGEVRKPKTESELKKNAKYYLKQAEKILDVNALEVRYNAEWLSPMTFRDVVRLASTFTVQQMLQRDMFRERQKEKREIYLHELLYPLMQGYDSVALKTDIELGGTDQTFNVLAGRAIQQAYGQKPQDIITVPILEGTDGKEKMGKSLNNYIGVLENAKEMFGKVMRVPDHLIVKYFELATFVSDSEIQKIKRVLKKGENPRNVKARLASEIVGLYHSMRSAEQAEKEFNNIFQKKEMPSHMEEVVVSQSSLTIVDLLVVAHFVASKSEARRMVEQGAVKIDSRVITRYDEIISIRNNSVVQIGKRKFARVKMAV